ncbi:D-ribose-binding periplasmic protein precursor [Pseudodesulfovibrio hydrargyri]|uniref:D-ribose-binding periplasmic protein n=1 Tax=Pseudodesulfovibrio hydrargyri TaxID=2125990 RepID=A0A1J5N369_9BACT|nr:substrate-binding domain-containing protein [Pseudodesulfovibrio hydrargyri]OIQ49264.1 D-ribose-binding periplasmic protein precursor [Pseudodesulfovibrio hydrargyri]
MMDSPRQSRAGSGVHAGGLPLLKLLLCCAFWLSLPLAALAGEFRILVVPKAESTRYWQAVKQGALDAGRECGAEVVFRGALLQEEVKAQQAILAEAMQDRPDAIVIAPTHTTLLADALNEARQRGTLVLGIDSSMEGVELTSYIATDNEAAGREAAEYLLGLTHGNGAALLLRHADDNGSTLDRERGFAETLAARAPGMKLIDAGFVGVSIGNAYHRTLTLLQEHPDVRAVFASSEKISIGCIQALRELNLGRRVRVLVFDETPEVREALRDKLIDAFMIQQPYRMGYLGVSTACDALKGKPVPERVVTRVKLVTDAGALRPETE